MNNQPAHAMTIKAKQSGYTLIEILIVVAILGILAAIAIPSYRANVVRGNRSVALAGLLDVANRQEQYYLDNRIYTTDLTDLGFPAALEFDNGGLSAIAYNDNQTVVAAAAGDQIYFVQINAANATTYTLSAVPQGAQAADAECATFALTSTGARSVSGTYSATDCW